MYSLLEDLENFYSLSPFHAQMTILFVGLIVAAILAGVAVLVMKVIDVIFHGK